MATSEKDLQAKIQQSYNQIKHKAGNLQENPLPWLLPALAFLAVFRLYPLLDAVRLSFTNKKLTSPVYEYVGLDSYAHILTSGDFYHMVVITIIFVAVSVALQLLAGLVIALAINHGLKRELRGHLVTRAGVLSAWIIPGIVIGILWSILLIEARYGVANSVITFMGGGIVPFLSDPQMALLSTIFANTWRGTAFSMIMQYAGLQQVSEQLYEAARIDGASPFQRFRHVTLPQMKPVIFINLVLITIYTLNTFDMIMSLTGGGPGRATEVLALFMYFEGFNRFNIGNAAAIAVLMLLVNIVMTIIYMRLFLNKEGEIE